MRQTEREKWRARELRVIGKIVKSSATTKHDQTEKKTRINPFTAYLDVLAPLCKAIVLGNLRLEQIVASHGRGEPSQGLPTAAAHTDQQGVTTRLAEDTADPGQVLQDVSGWVGVNVDILLGKIEGCFVCLFVCYIC